jgi:lipopolysaccharide assembly protein A
MRLIRFLIALLFVAIGVVTGALNPQPVTIDLGFATFPTTVGIALLVFILAGAVLGGLMLSASVILPLRQDLRRSRSTRVVVPPVRDPDSGA